MRYIADVNGNLSKAIESREDVSTADKKRAVKDYGDVKYADEKNKKYPVDTAEHVRAAASYWGMPKNRAKYSTEEQKIISKRIAAAKKKFGIGDETQKSRLIMTADGRMLLKSAKRKGKPKSDIERVMNHYGVDEKTAKKMLAKKSLDELLPERGTGLNKSTVKAHTRKTKTGKIANVNQYQNTKTKQADGEKPGLKPKAKKVLIDVLRGKAKRCKALLESGNKALYYKLRDKIERSTQENNIDPKLVWQKILQPDIDKTAKLINEQNKHKYDEKSIENKSNKKSEINIIDEIKKIKGEYVFVSPYHYKKKYLPFNITGYSYDDDYPVAVDTVEYRGHKKIPVNTRYKLEDIKERIKTGKIKKMSKSLSKSLEFSISGKELIAGIKSRIENIKKQIKMLKDLDTKDNSPQWKESELKRLKGILDNIDTEISYNLSPYELEEYGLLKSMNPELIKSLEFEIPGQRIKDGMLLKIAELRIKLDMMKEQFNNQNPVNNTNQAGDVIENNSDTKPMSKWDIESAERDIADLERQARNIDVKKKFKLSPYELKIYGL